MHSAILSSVWNYVNDNRIKTFIALGLTLVFTTKIYERFGKTSNNRLKDSSKCLCKRKSKLKIIYGSTTGSSRRLSKKLFNMLNNKLINELFDSVVWLCTDQYDPEDELLEDAADGSYLIILMPTYTDGGPPENARWFFKWITEASLDFRLSSDALSQLNYIILGIGDSVYGDDFCQCAFKLNSALRKLKAKSIYPTSALDRSAFDSMDDQFQSWFDRMLPCLIKQASFCCTTNNRYFEPTNFDHFHEEEASNATSDEDYDCDDDSDPQQNDPYVTTIDLEDIVSPENKSRKNEISDTKNKNKKDMITPELRKELGKQGYKLVGSHSGVKLCRWTKAMMRGRGGCYKFSFYGIESHRCMEATPSLACANKCVFCWRHHTNPVGTEWKWNMDEPEMILDGLVRSHRSMINEFKGVPGVLPERFDEAMQIRHCALSLVGEPIMYPEINRFVKLLHSKQISTFLVTNAQFPNAIKQMDPVTQLYVSVDASSKASLKKIDRPLFKDFWERLLESLRSLSMKGQRTVYRLTLVKSWNSDEIEGYAKLAMIGKPDFIEIKGVTFCGTSMKESNLTMKNVPWHEEVVKFGEKLLEKINQLIKQHELKQNGMNGLENLDENQFYGMACEHEHSNCILLARKKFLINEEWWTWIDYEKFNKLIQDYYESNGEKSFTSMDYVVKTPEWAVFGAKEHGFNPNDTRFRKKRHHTYE